MPTTDTQVNNLIINKLTKQQYESIQNPSDTELYLVPDEIDNTPTSGSDNTVTSGGVYTALQDKADKVSNATNGNFAGLDSNGNLTDSGSNASDFLTQHQDISGKADKILIQTTQPSGGMLPNVMYNLGTLSSDTTFSLAAATDNTVANVWSWNFSIGNTVPNLTWPTTGITAWDDGVEPSSVANTYYEINVMNGIAIAYTIELPSI